MYYWGFLLDYRLKYNYLQYQNDMLLFWKQNQLPEMSCYILPADLTQVVSDTDLAS